jgi:two-component system response regulator RpfG
MQRHPVIGHEILKGSASKYVRMGALIALGHHERYDGKGYPSGLDGDHIPLCARVVAVADVYDALTSARPYKKAWKPADALEYLRAQRGKHFDPRLVDAFLGVSERVLEVQRDLQDPTAETGAK